MSGGELFDYVVEKGTLSELEASRIVRKITSAIALMHSLGIIHRDLKPENLLLTSKGADAEVKLIDFGLAKVDIKIFSSPSNFVRKFRMILWLIPFLGLVVTLPRKCCNDILMTSQLIFGLISHTFATSHSFSLRPWGLLSLSCSVVAFLLMTIVQELLQTLSPEKNLL